MSVSDDDLRRAREAWPGVAFEPEALRAFVERRRGEGGAGDAHLADLCLAFAASRGDPAAIRAIDERVLSAIEPPVKHIDPSPAFLDEVRQALRVRLLVGAEGSPPHIADYQGRGPLVGWVRVAAARVALNLKRPSGPKVEPDDVLSEVVAREPDPELQHMKAMYRAELASSLRAALAALPERDRLTLRLHYVDGLTLAQIGALYGVHESTVSRRVKAAAERVGASARAALVARLGVSAGSVDSIARMVESQLDLSIGRILQA